MASEDRDLFEREMRGVKRLQTAPRAAIRRDQVSELAQRARRQSAATLQQTDRNFLSLDHVEWLDPYFPLEFKRAGVQNGVFRKLKQGRYPLEARLDLHRMRAEQARQEVYSFIRDAYRYELRTLIIVPGKGTHSQTQPAQLKSYLNKWLQEFEEVQAFVSAQPQHGGVGAVYVLLKKSPQAREKNRDHFNRGRVPEKR